MAKWLLVAGLCAAGYWSARLAWADRLIRRESAAALLQAASLAPSRADVRARLGDWAGAVARNPYDSASWIRHGLDAESRGDFGAAQRSLLRAADADRLFQPSWTLANYYFRRQDPERFWFWARAAAGRSPQTPAALYRLCRERAAWGEIYRRVVNGQPRLLAGFLFWALPRADLAGLQSISSLAAPADRDAANALVGRFLELGSPADAVKTWNRLTERRVLEFAPLDPGRGASLTNGDFLRPPRGEAFNWSVLQVAGVSSRASRGEMRLEFSGRQPENCDLLAQTLPVLAGRRYRLRCRYRTAGIAPGAGPRWLPGGTPLSSEDWRETESELTTQPGEEVVRLRLAYQRVPGTTRIAGTLWLAHVRLELPER